MSAAPLPALRIGILGAASIARSFIDGVRCSPAIAVTAIASRDPSRAMAFARDAALPRVHTTYDALLADPEIDAVYLPLPNNLHAAWSIRAADAGKHVLCEKPLATSSAEARKMFDAASRNGVFLAEAYPYRAQPQTLKLRTLLQEQAVGRLKLIQASFGFPLTDTSNIRMDPALGGGSLMDAGCYPVSLVRAIAGERPRRVQAFARWAQSSVDLTLVASLEFPSGLLAQVSCSFVTARYRHALIVGDAGSIDTTYLNHSSADFPAVLRVSRGSGPDAQIECIESPAVNGFLAEAESFRDLVAGGWDHWVGPTPAESIDIALMLEAITASARSGVAVEIAQ